VSDGKQAFDEIADSANEMEWLQARKKLVTAGNVAGVLGASTYSSPASVYADMIETEIDLKDNEFMRAGRRLEPFIGEWILELIEEDRVEGDPQWKGAPWGKLIQSRRYPWLGATPDWIVHTAPDKAGTGSPVYPFQIKNSMMAGMWQAGIPEHVLIQCLTEQLVWGVQKSLVGVLLTGNRPRYAWIDQDDHKDLREKILEETKFFHEHVERRLPLSRLRMDGSEMTSHALFAIHPQDNGKTVELSGELQAKALDFDLAKKRESESKKIATAIANELKAAMGDFSRAVFPDGSGFTWTHEHVKAATELRAAYDKRVLRRKKGPKAAHE